MHVNQNTNINGVSFTFRKATLGKCLKKPMAWCYINSVYINLTNVLQSAANQRATETGDL